MNKAIAYTIWRFSLHAKEYGTYDDIDWAVGKKLLRPGKTPGRIAGWIVKAIIRWRRAKQGESE